jgi:hypothetical protein
MRVGVCVSARRCGLDGERHGHSCQCQRENTFRREMISDLISWPTKLEKGTANTEAAPI